MCDRCYIERLPIKVTAKTSNKNTEISRFKKRNQKKRKISANNEFEEEPLTIKLENESSGVDISEILESSIVSTTTTEDSGVSETTSSSSNDHSNYNYLPIVGGVFDKSKEFYEKYGLKLVGTPPLGDCCMQACMKSYLNRSRNLMQEEENDLTSLKHSLCNLVTQGLTTVEGSKYSEWRGYSVGCDLDSSLYMNTDDVSIIAHYFQRKIIVSHPYRGDDGLPKLEVRLHVPVKGKKSISKTYRLDVEDNFDLWFYADRKSMIREYVNPSILMESNKAIMIQYHSSHYEALILKDKEERKLQWPEPISHNIFEPNVDRRNCTSCNMISWICKDIVNCSVCDRWIHSSTGSTCLKYWHDIDVNIMTCNFYCTFCITRLINYTKTFKDNPSIDYVINCLRSFNLKDTDVRSGEEIDVMKIVIERALEED